MKNQNNVEKDKKTVVLVKRKINVNKFTLESYCSSQKV